MSFSYSGDPSFSTTDAIRFLLGDTTYIPDDEESYEFEDEEIEWAFAQEPDIWFAAAICADSAGSRYGNQPTSQTIGETSVTFGDRAVKWNSLSAQLRNTRRQGAVLPWAGGWLISQKQTQESNSDREEFPTKKTTVPEVS